MNLHGALKATTPTDREIVLTRVFDAPRAVVFQALTKPELLRRWYVPGGWALTECEVDPKVGGGFCFVWRSPDGAGMRIHGVYREVCPPERLVHTEVFDAFAEWACGELLTTTVLSEDGGKTTLTTTMRYPSQKIRDTVLHSGMTRGVGQMYDRLDEMLGAGPTPASACEAVAA